MYGLHACYLTKSQLNSLDFVINRLLMKLFKTNNIDIVKYCQYCSTASVLKHPASRGSSALISLTRTSRNVIIHSSLDSAIIANVKSANNMTALAKFS